MAKTDKEGNSVKLSAPMSVSLFSIIPIEVFQDKRLTLEHVRVLGTLLSFRAKNTDVVWPSRQLISDRCGMHVSNISSATSDLVKLGWLEKEGKGGFSKSSRYKITVPDLDSVDPTARASKLRTVADSATVAGSTTVAESTTVVESTSLTVVESARGGVADSTTRKEQTKEHTSEQTNDAAGDKSPPAPKKKSGLTPEMKSACQQTWDAYSAAYFTRYSAEPVWNAKVAGQVVQFVRRVGVADAPHISSWFPSHKASFYVGKGHTVGVMLQDAEKLRTEWATGRQMTATKARQADRAGSTMDAVNAILARGGDPMEDSQS